MGKLSIKDLQKGMNIDLWMADEVVVMIVNHVYKQPEGILGYIYAVAHDDNGNPHLLTSKSKLTLYKETKECSPVICSICGKQMDIKEWMLAKDSHWWDSQERGYRDGFMIPADHGGHLCLCGKLWIYQANNELINIGNVLIWEHRP